MSRRRIDVAERRARLVVRHRHAAAARTDDVVAITDGLVALHSSDPVSVYLSATARMVHPDLAALDTALYDDRSLLRHHAMRRTLWVLGHDAARAAHHAATTTIAAVQLRQLLAMLEAGGVANAGAWYADAAARIEQLLPATGPLTAREVGAEFPELAVKVPVGTGTFATTQAAHTRVLLMMGFQGRVLRARPTGTWINGQYRYAATSAWFPDGFDAAGTGVREHAADLARRWLRAFGPGLATDLKWWARWTVAITERALADVGAVEVELDGGTGYVLPDDVDPVGSAEPAAVLLPGLDPSTMGWKSRAFHLDPDHVPVLFDRNGNGGPAVWVDGRIVGGWTQRKDGTIALRMLDDVGSEATAAIEARAHALEALLGGVRFTTRFPAPFQAALPTP
ncbi:winged helix DNA-binding domain-containing protein [Pseudonocardia humida]|uniref:AlkZ family DNA glycosylase n=1 Tax=Pseudonocardia humida TaxID=2800819 RepID=A0ABT0ZTB9_9PSEU|nr:winged helix DNA-binding domain-containing protein [Pseudonocardia humida]MCO1653957.1 AlkZ family DNA glycosylase [Pseudonocardia humida]